jgi:hypothetical protein
MSRAIGKGEIEVHAVVGCGRGGGGCPATFSAGSPFAPRGFPTCGRLSEDPYDPLLAGLPQETSRLNHRGSDTSVSGDAAIRCNSPPANRPAGRCPSRCGKLGSDSVPGRGLQAGCETSPETIRPGACLGSKANDRILLANSSGPPEEARYKPLKPPIVLKLRSRDRLREFANSIRPFPLQMGRFPCRVDFPCVSV